MSVSRVDTLFIESHRVSIHLQFLFIQILLPIVLSAYFSSDTHQSPFDPLFPRTPSYNYKYNFYKKSFWKQRQCKLISFHKYFYEVYEKKITQTGLLINIKCVVDWIESFNWKNIIKIFPRNANALCINNTIFLLHYPYLVRRIICTK